MPHEPTYRLGWTRCPYPCGTEGLVVPIMCPGCRSLFGACDEADFFITDLRTLIVDGVTYHPPDRLCPGCQAVQVASFVPADFARLVEEGFSEADILRLPDPFPACSRSSSAKHPITYVEYQRQKASNPASVTIITSNEGE